MNIINEYSSDIEAILSHRYDNGGDLWATLDKKLLKGSPFSTFESILYLLELGVSPQMKIMKDAADLIFSVWQKDGSFRIYPKGTIYPCQTAEAVKVLCYLGYVTDERVQSTLRHLIDIQYSDGGLRCNKFSFGHGEETNYSNPNPTLIALDAFRFSDYLNNNAALDKAVDFLLEHWTIRKPIGPCHYGIGTLFMQAEYPFRNYNLFEYVYILSFYDRAKKDSRFHEALNILKSKTINGQIVVERVVPKLAKLKFCEKGKPSELATKRYLEILKNIDNKE